MTKARRTADRPPVYHGRHPAGDRQITPAFRAVMRNLPDLSRGACRVHDPEIWFPFTNDLQSLDVKLAAAICTHCPVWVECLTWALENREYYGVWGGKTAAQRRTLLDPKRRRTHRDRAGRFLSS